MLIVIVNKGIVVLEAAVEVTVTKVIPFLAGLISG